MGSFTPFDQQPSTPSYLNSAWGGAKSPAGYLNSPGYSKSPYQTGFITGQSPKSGYNIQR